MVDLYYENDDPHNSIILAHKNDLTGGKNYVQKFTFPFLSTIKNWLDDPEHENDIITIHLESYVRSYKKIIYELDAVDAKDEDKISKPKLKSYLFDLCEYNGAKAKEGSAECYSSAGKPLDPQKLQWPTLGEMRKSNKRLVIFSDKAEDAGYGIMHVSNTMETQYNLSKYPSCEMRREGRLLKAPIFTMNHFYRLQAVPLGIGRHYEKKKANKFDKTAARVGICTFQEKQWPNFIAVDNVGFEEDETRQIVLAINNRHNEICYYVAQKTVFTEKFEDTDKGGHQDSGHVDTKSNDKDLEYRDEL